jgi:hypothetical protein
LGYFRPSLVWKNTKRQDIKGFAKEWFLWIKIFLVLELLVFFPFLLFFWAIDPMTNFLLVHLTIVILTLVNRFYIGFFSKDPLRYGQHQFEKQRKEVNQRRIENLSMDKRSKEIESKLEEVLDRDKRFLQHGYSIHALAADTEIPCVFIDTVYQSSSQYEFF